MAPSKPAPPKPQSGRIATHEDLGLIMSLQDWLNATSPDKLGCHDAWAVTNTDDAFAFNNEMGVQMTSESNRWVSGGDPLFTVKGGFPGNLGSNSSIIPQDLSLNGRGLYSKTDSSTTSLTVSETTGLKVESKFEIDGFSFGVEASFDQTNTSENTQSTSNTETTTEKFTLKPHSKFHYKVIEETTTIQTLYGLDFSIGSEVSKDGTITGGIAKATQFPDPNNQLDFTYLSKWDTFFPVENIANTLQTAKYHVTNEKVVTKIITN